MYTYKIITHSFWPFFEFFIMFFTSWLPLMIFSFKRRLILYNFMISSSLGSWSFSKSSSLSRSWRIIAKFCWIERISEQISLWMAVWSSLFEAAIFLFLEASVVLTGEQQVCFCSETKVRVDYPSVYFFFDEILLRLR